MGLLECASGNSRWRGYDYHREIKAAPEHQKDIQGGCFVDTREKTSYGTKRKRFLL